MTRAGDGDEALASNPAEIAVFDISLPDLCGISVARAMLKRGLLLQVVFFTATTEQSVVDEAREIGPVVFKREGVEALVRALHQLRNDDEGGSK